jgi:hypothetical protein
VVRTVTSGMAFAPGFATSELVGSGMTAAAMWRPTSAAANAAAINSAQHQTVAIAQNVTLASLHTQKQYVVTTPDAGRGNKGTSPWGFPV